MLNVMEQGNRQEIRNQLLLYKERGIVQFDRVLTIPSVERITAIAMTETGRMRVSAALSGAIKSAMDSINLRISLSEDQVFDLAEEIIDQSAEDNLGLEDVLLFLQQLITGKAGKIYDRMDIPTFFELFENYRQERHETLRNIQYEQSANQKALGPTDRTSEDPNPEKEAMRSAMSEHLKNLYKPK